MIAHRVQFPLALQFQARFVEWNWPTDRLRTPTLHYLPSKLLTTLQLQEVPTCLSILDKGYNTRWCHLSFEFTDRFKQNDADRYRQSDIISDFKPLRMCLTRSIALQCGLSAGKLNRQSRYSSDALWCIMLSCNMLCCVVVTFSLAPKTECHFNKPFAVWVSVEWTHYMHGQLIMWTDWLRILKQSPFHQFACTTTKYVVRRMGKC